MTKPVTKSDPGEVSNERFPTPLTREAKPKLRDFGVAPSPFNGVKLELGFAILLGAVLWLAADSITANEAAQWLILLVYGLLSMGWLVMRTRAVLRRCMTNGKMSP